MKAAQRLLLVKILLLFCSFRDLNCGVWGFGKVKKADSTSLSAEADGAQISSSLEPVMVAEMLTAGLGLNKNSDTVILLNNDQNKELTRRLISVLWELGIQVSSFKFEAPSDFEDFDIILKHMLKISRKMFILSLIQIEELIDILIKMRNHYLENDKIQWIAAAANESSLKNNLTLQVARDFQVGFIVPKSKTSLSYSVVEFSSMENSRPDTLFTTEREGKQVKINEINSAPRDKVMNLKGVTLKVAVVDNWPFFGLNSDGNNHTPSSGIDVSVLETLAEIMNFTIRIVSPEDGQWGGPQGDGEITGMIGMVAKGEADLAIDEITITALRTSVVDFTHPYYLESSTILSKAPQAASRALAVFSPFPTEIWGVLAISVLGYGLLTWTFQHYSLEDNGKRKHVTLSSFTMKSLQSMTVQGTPVEATWWPLRFLLITWYIFALIIDALYNATLTAVLAAPTFERPIETLEDILNHGNTLPVVTEGSSIHELFETATSGIYRQMFLAFDPKESLASTVDEGVDKVLAGDFALIEAKLASEIRASIRNRERFYISRQSFYPQAYGIACRKGSPLKQAFNTQLARLVEGGLISKWKDNQVRKVTISRSSKDQDEEVSGAGPNALSLNHLQGAFFLFVIGILMAFLIGIFECIFNRKVKIWN